MQQNIIKCTTFFQQIFYSRFRQITPKTIETVLLLSLGHLFGLINPNQLADALDMGKMRTMMVFGKPLRSCEILRIWSQHPILRTCGCGFRQIYGILLPNKFIGRIFNDTTDLRHTTIRFSWDCGRDLTPNPLD